MQYRLYHPVLNTQAATQTKYWKILTLSFLLFLVSVYIWISIAYTSKSWLPFFWSSVPSSLWQDLWSSFRICCVQWINYITNTTDQWKRKARKWKRQGTLLIRPYSPISNQILQSLRFVLNQSLCRTQEQCKQTSWHKGH